MNALYLFFIKDFSYVFPEIFLLVAILTFLLFGVFYTPKLIEERSPYVILVLTNISLLVFLILLILLLLQFDGINLIFGARFLITNYVVLMKIFLIIFLFLFFTMSINYFERDIIKSYEFIVILLLSVLGMLVMLNAYDFMTMYLALELQTICFYILAAYKTHSNSSTEAGIKYFVLGSFSSGLLLFGISLIYGFSGTTNFQDLSYIFFADNADSAGILVLGMLFVLVGLLFKLGAAPFHVWLPDVYDGSPTIVTGFFASMTKLPALFLFVTTLYVVFYSLVGYWHFLLLLVAGVSLFIGSLGALYQNKVKRLMAYSGISHMGFLLLSLSAGSLQGLQAMTVYIFVYLLLTINFFAIIFAVRKYAVYNKLKTLGDFRPLFKTNPFLAIVLSLNLFSYAGIPPLAGFFGKFYVLSVATTAQNYFIVALAILFSTVSSVYYIRLIKIMFFEKIEKWSLYIPLGVATTLVLGLTTTLNLFFCVYASPLMLIVQNTIYTSFF
jgi:NADH-quinone oxidoreductase subunit N